ncbi:porin family protein [Litorilituus lipolyticus]|uniref:Porin family protein n=1 Tax=Litorilituus lipolyticus TaxID=2491017 RepID=A0A502KVN3_9GAMM|nr:porin family protein [Litorilituus lipolyticus]TPH14051.1 porin family protein [Litorilituus lipolyticus]
MKNILPLVLLAPFLLLLSMTSQAQNNSGFYIGVQYSNQKITSSSDVNLDTAGVTFGYQFHQYFSLETRLNIGTSEYSSVCACGEENIEHVYKQEIDNQASIFIKGLYPINNDFSVYALAGITNSSYNLNTKSFRSVVDGDRTITQVKLKDTETHSDNGFTYGLGINYKISEKFSIFLDYQILPDLVVSTLGSSSWKSANIGVNYNF